jgi:hypothetical protein
MSQVTIRLPELHAGQETVESQARRFNALACGRRWGKSKYLTRRMALRALRGQFYGYFAPTYKILTEVFNEAASRLSPVGRVLKAEKRIELMTGGLVEFWTLEDEDAGRSRRYHEVGIDEAGLVKDLETRWHQAIRPTLTDYRGEAWLAGTPKGRGFFHTAFALGQDPHETDWQSWQMPTSANPYIPKDEIEAAKRQMPERSFLQEFEAVFLDEAGGVFRGVRDAIGEPPKVPHGTVYLGVDIAKVNDFTVVCGVDSAGRQVYFDRFNQISWERQEEAIVSAYRRFASAKVVIEVNNQGDPMFERLRKRGVSVEGFQTTNASKESLIDNLAMLIENKRVTLLPQDEQTNELLAYQYEITRSRNIRMNAPEGMHDDTVIALALACWTIRERPVGAAKTYRR